MKKTILPKEYYISLITCSNRMCISCLNSTIFSLLFNSYFYLKLFDRNGAIVSLSQTNSNLTASVYLVLDQDKKFQGCQIEVSQIIERDRYRCILLDQEIDRSKNSNL